MKKTILINLGSSDDKPSEWDYLFDAQDGLAAYVYDGTANLMGSGYSATLLPNREMGEGVRQVECFDFSNWIKRFRAGHRVFVKMDIEGSEYAILQKMIDDGTIDIVERFWIEWHDWLYPEYEEWGDRLRERIPWEELSRYEHNNSHALIESWITSTAKLYEDAALCE